MRKSALLIALPLLFLCSAWARADEAEVAKLIEALDTATGAALYATVDDLADHGADAKAAVPALVDLLGDADENLRWRAARTLGAIGPDAAPAVPTLAERLSDENPLVRAQSAYALGLIGEASKSVVPQLVKTVGDEDPLVRRAALRALHRIKPDRDVTRPLFLKLLQESKPDVVTAVLHSMAEMGADAVPALDEALDHQEARYWALLVVQELGPPAKSLVPKITEMIKDEDEPEVRMHAILALGAIGEDAESAVPAIMEQFAADKVNAVRYAAAYALPQMGAKEAKDVLQRAVEDNAETEGDLFLRVIAARGLAQLFPEDEEIEQQSVDVFIEGLQSKDRNVRRAAVRAMAESDAPSESVAPQLVAAIQQADDELVSDVVAMLSSLGAQAVPRVKRGLANKDLRGYAAVILGNIGPEAKDAVPELVDALDVEGDPDFRREVLFTLGRIGPPAAPAVPKIIEILKSDTNERVISAACYALGSVGTEASEAAPALVGIYNDGTEFQKMVAIWALLKVRPGVESVVQRAIPLMIKGLGYEREEVRTEAAKALGSIGPKAKAALPHLQNLLDDESETVREATKAAIESIQQS